MLAKPCRRAAQFSTRAPCARTPSSWKACWPNLGAKGHRPDPARALVVTLYELVPAAGVKSARVVALSDDIARSMSVAACRVSVVPGRNAIGIELPNQKRAQIALFCSDLLRLLRIRARGGQTLPMALGETIGGAALYRRPSPACRTC